jgi:tetratricopeptide (TPR) repeat protein
MTTVGATSATAPEARWIHRPAVDLIVGCGAWSAPLLLLAGQASSATRPWAVAFYALALAFNYPHFMATVYRAYHTRSEFARYRVFTLHITTLLALAGVASHVWPALVPWLFTVYLTWSPWHYTGQNYGLAMMFARRNGAAPTDRERRALHAAFVASYALLFVSFHTGPSTDPLIRSLGITEAIATPARGVLLAVVLALGGGAVGSLMRRAGPAAMLAPCTLVATQFMWFVAPAIAAWIGAGAAPQTRYSSGVLAVMHSAQYLWITSYYARREAEAAPGGRWRPWAYAATLVGGGIALFIPGPWVASYLFRADFTRSVLIFTAIVNIHHFILDGAIWKLRDRRVAAVLVDAAPGATAGTRLSVQHATRWLAGRVPPARVLRIAGLVVLVGWAAVDQARFVLGTSDRDVAALTRAEALNPYDSSVQRRRARLLAEQGRYPEADAEYQQYLAVHPDDGEALLNAGVLANTLGREDEAVRRWEAALETDAARVNASRQLAQVWATRADALELAGRPTDAARAFQRVLTLDEQGGDSSALGADWFNYGQFLRRQQAEPHLVLVSLLQAEHLLARKGDERTATVRAARDVVERERPDAMAAVRRSPAEALADARALFRN